MGLHSKHPADRSNGDVDDEDDYGDGNRNIIMSLIGQLHPGADLSRITLPTFILERKSMLERITNTLQHPGMLADATSTSDPEMRFVEIVRWYMSGWHIAPKAVKKPLNPVLGEYFSCYWELDDRSKAYYVAEQTSHHAPKSSYFYAHPNRKIRADGIVIPKSKFLGNSAASMMEGIARVQLGEHLDSQGQPEEYFLTQPNIYARNVIFGTLKLEIGDKAVVTCPALDMECVVEFKVKGYISGTYHEIKGIVTRHKEPLYEITGKWNDVIYIKPLKSKHGKKEVFFDTNKDVVHKPLVRPISEQGEFESRRLWEKVCQALSERNQKVATDEKFDIEDHQRQLQKLRNEGREPEFQPKLFQPVEDQLQFLICVDEALKHAKSETEVEHILQSIMPILPGTKFPSDFEEPAAKKARGFQSGGVGAGGASGASGAYGAAGGAVGAGGAAAGAAAAPSQAPHHARKDSTYYDFENDSDEFVDAPEHP